jgi:hypothetical protein
VASAAPVVGLYLSDKYICAEGAAVIADALKVTAWLDYRPPPAFRSLQDLGDISFSNT